MLMEGEEGAVDTIYKRTRAGAPDETSWPRTGRWVDGDWHAPNRGKTTENSVVVAVVGVVGVVVVVVVSV